MLMIRLVINYEYYNEDSAQYSMPSVSQVHCSEKVGTEDYLLDAQNGHRVLGMRQSFRFF